MHYDYCNSKAISSSLLSGLLMVLVALELLLLPYSPYSLSPPLSYACGLFHTHPVWRAVAHDKYYLKGIYAYDLLSVYVSPAYQAYILTPFSSYPLLDRCPSLVSLFAM